MLPRDASIPNDLVENPYGRTGSYGKIIDGKFVETLRIDPATLKDIKAQIKAIFI